jgi:elongation factor 1-gamma
MPAFGTLHTAAGNARSTAIKVVAKANNLDLEIVEHTFPIEDTNYLLLNRLAKVPTFVGTDGYVLSECIAIAIYRMFRLFLLHTTPTIPT